MQNYKKKTIQSTLYIGVTTEWRYYTTELRNNKKETQNIAKKKRRKILQKKRDAKYCVSTSYSRLEFSA